MAPSRPTRSKLVRSSRCLPVLDLQLSEIVAAVAQSEAKRLMTYCALQNILCKSPRCLNQ